MNKAELIDAVAAKTKTDKKSTGAVIETMVDTVLRAVATGERVAITGFGVFEKRERAARTARNPRTGVAIRLKKTSVPAFRPGQGFKDVVSGAKRLTKNTTAKRTSASSATKAAPAKASAKKTAPAKKSAPAKKTTATKATTKRAPAAKKTAPSKRVAAKVLASKAPAKKSITKKTAAKVLAKKSGKKAKK
ncbi:MAG: HU family DNA-binding protein [Actinomycetota bacterium]|nr:HU family DNA-binding protein [Actinomycetota bacterium]